MTALHEAANLMSTICMKEPQTSFPCSLCTST